MFVDLRRRRTSTVVTEPLFVSLRTAEESPDQVKQMDANGLVIGVGLFRIDAPVQRDVGEVGGLAVELRNSRRAGMRNPVSCTRDFSWRDPSSILPVSRRSAPLVLIATFDIISFATTIASLEGYRH